MRTTSSQRGHRVLRRSLTTTCANSPAPRAPRGRWRGAPRPARASSVPRPISRVAQRLLARRRDEDLHGLGHRLADLARALDLDLEHHRAAARRGAARGPSAACRSAGPSSARARRTRPARDAALELLVVEEVVVDPVRLAGPRRRVVAETDSSSSGTRSSSVRISVPLPTPEGPVMTKTVAKRASASGAAWTTSSVRWRCERPPIVLLGEIRHWTRTLLTFTRPYFGTASSMSKTLAVSTYSGGSSSRSWMLARPAFRSRLSWRGACGSRSRAGGPPCAGGGSARGRPRLAWWASSWLAAWAASLHRVRALARAIRREFA